jgi:hypothetical protein
MGAKVSGGAGFERGEITIGGFDLISGGGEFFIGA